uniref:Uncharacterized protein n=1 Tax=Panagrellus redivivus TaxID=6233 RepID=A0A7E4ZVP0_PANRE
MWTRISRRSEVDSKVRFTFEKKSRFAKPPDISDGLFHYRVITLPTGCTIKILGATDPKSTTPIADSMKTAKLVIYILAGAAGAILLISLGLVIYCLCWKRRRATSNTAGV